MKRKTKIAILYFGVVVFFMNAAGAFLWNYAAGLKLTDTIDVNRIVGGHFFAALLAGLFVCCFDLGDSS